MSKLKRSKRNTNKKNTSISAPPSKRHLWLYRLISLVLIPVIFFSFLELGLHCFGYGYSPKAIIKCKLDKKEVYCSNPKFAWRFFPHLSARYFDGFVFDTKKPPKTYRIFVLGASAAMGVPAPAYNFGHLLEVMLDELYPDTDFNVHTAAMAAINSYAVLEIAKDCAEYKPDLFIIYLGNNEVVGPFGPGTVFAPLSPNLSLIRANLALKSTRTGQLLEQIMHAIAPGGKEPQQWGGMEMFLDKQVRYNDPALEIAYQHFEKNLQDICQIGLNAGASVIVSNVPSNLKDCPPFGSLHRPELKDAERQAWQQSYADGIAHEKEGRYEQAIAQYQAAEKIDAEFADLEFRMGACYWNMGDYQKAKERYIKAREYDTLRFRADNRINDIIRAVAENKQKNLYFVDSIAAVEENSPHQIPDAELFYEHVHMKFKGNYVLASSILPIIQKTLPAAQKPITTRLFSENEVSKYLAYTDYERVVYLDLVCETLLNRPPFTNQLHHQETLINNKQQIRKGLLNLQKSGLGTCLIRHQQAVQNRPDDWHLLFQYAAFLNSGLNDIKAEEVQLRKVLELCPYSSAYLNLGINLHQQGKILKAQSILNDLVKMNPNVLQAHIELASIYRQRRDYVNDIQHLLKALSLESAYSVQLYIYLADAYDKTGKPEQAFQALNKAIQIFPNDKTAPLHVSLAYIMYTQGDYKNAFEEMQRAYQIDPNIKNDAAYNSFLVNLENKLKQ